MPLIQYAESGTEHFIPYAKKKLRELHEIILSSDVGSLSKRIDADDGSAIYLNSLHLGKKIFSDKIRITGGSPRYIYAANIVGIPGFSLVGLGETGYTGFTVAPDASGWRTFMPGDTTLLEQLMTGNILEGVKGIIKRSHPLYGSFDNPDGVSDGEVMEFYYYEMQDEGLGPFQGVSAITGAILKPLAVCTYRSETDTFEPIFNNGAPKIPALYNPMVDNEVHAWDAVLRPVPVVTVPGPIWHEPNILMVVLRKAFGKGMLQIMLQQQAQFLAILTPPVTEPFTSPFVAAQWFLSACTKQPSGFEISAPA